MEIYHKKLPWLGFVFLVPTIWLSLSIAGYTSLSISSSDLTGVYIAIGVCLVVTLQCFMGSTRFYFDNDEQSAIQVRKHFYGEKIIRIPYENIQLITVRCYQNGAKGLKKYQVGFTENTRLFGHSATKFTPLRIFIGDTSDLSLAREFAQEICSYTTIEFFDDSNTIRAEMGHNH